MDREQARFILRSFRASSADASDAEFAEALALAANDRELGEWLAREHATDTAFAAALSRVSLPEGLREEVLASFDATGDTPVERDSADQLWSSALASVSPPSGLRAEILAAMEMSAPRVIRRPAWKRFALPLAAAAGIALALVVTRPGASPPAVPVAALPTAPSGAVPISHVEDSAISLLESPGFTLDLSNPDHEVLFQHIRKSGRACPGGAVPKGLEDIPGLGCRNLEVEGKEGAIVCFRRAEGDVVHLVVFRQSDISCKLPTCGHPKLGKHGDWSVARWQKDGRVFLLLGHVPEKQLDELF